MSPWLTILGLVVLAALVVLLLRFLRKDHIDAFLEKRKAESKVATRADFVEGADHIPVALSLGQTAIYYENPDLEASFDLDRIDEVEYDDELATGRSIEQGYKVLRLRSHGRAVEFLLEKAEAPKWQSALPPTVNRGASAPAAQVM